ncbi:hypothetical protein PG990_014074 [Apiospora arundinis]
MRVSALFLAVSISSLAWASIVPETSYQPGKTGLEERAKDKPKPKPKPRPKPYDRPKPTPDPDADKPFTFVINCSPYLGSGGKQRNGAGETCNTMCFGTQCHLKTNTYTFDGADEPKKDVRRERVGCNRPKGVPGWENVCKTEDWKKKNGDKTSCDEFPFASTSDADGGKQFFRCASETNQNSQGAQVKNAGAACKKRNKKNGKPEFPCKFTLSFKGEEHFKYCKKNPDCKPDGNLFTKGNKPMTKRDLDTRTPALQGGYYQLRSGETIYSPSDLEIGTVAVRNVFSNNTIPDDEAKVLAARGLFDDSAWEDEEFVEDEVVAKL